MRVLLIPYQSDKLMKRCSMYHWTKVFLRELTALDNVHVYWPVPRGQRPPDEFLNDKITIIPIEPMQSSMYYEMTYIDETLIQLFHSLTGKYVVDLILCYKPMIAMYIKRRLSAFLDKMCPPVVNIHAFMLSGSRFGFLDEDYWRMQAGGMVGWNVYANEAHEARGHAAVRPYLSGTEFRNVKTLGYYVSAFDPVRMDAVAIEKPKEPITLCYAQAMSATYQADDVLEEMDLLYKAGRKVKILITTSSADGSKFPADYDYVEQHGSLPQAEFMKKLYEGHVFVALIKDMEMCSSMLEQMYAGQIGILPNAPWARAMVPPSYPFLYRGLSEMRTMLRHVVEHYWEYQDLVNEVREFICTKYDAKKLGRDFALRLRQLHEDWVFKDSRVDSGLTSVLKKLDDIGRSEITWNALSYFIKKNTTFGLSLENLKTRADTMSRWTVHWTMQRLGWVDTCKTDMPIYKRQS